jgi:hypothetical protein
VASTVINDEDSNYFNKERIMKNSYLSVVLTLTCLLGLGESSRAQDTGRVAVNVPFEFVAGGATLPAGTYHVSGISAVTHSGPVLIRRNDKGALLLPLVFDGASAGHAQFDFEHVGDRNFLSKIETPEGVYTFGSARAMTKVAKLKNRGTLVASGAN